MQTRPAERPPDLLSVPRSGLIETHIIHEFQRERVIDNLKGCYGKLICDRYRAMLASIFGKRIIDCGCGFGLFSRVAIDAGYEVTSIDIDDTSLQIAEAVASIPCSKQSVYATSLPNGSCDSAVCCDSIQHFEIDFFLPEMIRLGVKRVIVYDSNTHNPFLKLYRSSVGHEETHDRSPEQIVAEFQRHGYKLVELHYENIVSLPISGGLQRPPLPLLHRFPIMVGRVDRWLARLARTVGIARRIAFRYLLVFEAIDNLP